MAHDLGRSTIYYFLFSYQYCFVGFGVLVAHVLNMAHELEKGANGYNSTGSVVGGVVCSDDCTNRY